MNIQKGRVTWTDYLRNNTVYSQPPKDTPSPLARVVPQFKIQLIEKLMSRAKIIREYKAASLATILNDSEVRRLLELGQSDIGAVLTMFVRGEQFIKATYNAARKSLKNLVQTPTYESFLKKVIAKCYGGNVTLVKRMGVQELARHA